MDVGLHSPPLSAPTPISYTSILFLLYPLSIINSHAFIPFINPSCRSLQFCHTFLTPLIPHLIGSRILRLRNHHHLHLRLHTIIYMELSVLERQRAVLQRIYQQAQSDSWKNQENDHLEMMDSVVIDHQQVLSQCWHPLIKADHRSLHARIHKALPDPQTNSIVSDTNNSSITRVPIPKPDWQCNSRLANRQGNSKKRKAEFDIEEEIKDKRAEAEEAGEEKSDITTKTEREASANTCSKGSSKVSEVQKPDYIHVRARRGQATDSHSLAERARREKISKKMKCLQDLVPGCNKVTGKAGMLDEIINYVQSLQKQVEFLSMKLAAINPRVDFSIDNIFAKEISAYIASLPPAAQFEAANSACFQYNPMQQGCGAQIPMDQSQVLPQKTGTSSLPIPEVFLDSSCISQLQQLSGWESDWQSLFNAGFH